MATISDIKNSHINPFKPLYNIMNTGNAEEKYRNLRNFPIIVDVELTNTCNFRCMMCNTGSSKQKRKRGFMSDEVYSRLLEQIGDKNVALRFIGAGEPLLHHKFLMYITEAKEKNLLCHFNTNASLFTTELMEKIIKLKIDSMKFSVQGVDAQSYNEMRRGGDFLNLTNSVKTFHKMRGDSPLPYIHIATTTSYESEEQIEDFKKTFTPYCDLLTAGVTILVHFDTEASELSEERKLIFRKLKSEQDLCSRHMSVCPDVFDRLCIYWNGDISPCCNDYEGVMTVGNIMENTLEEIWNNQKLNTYRKILSNCEYDKIELCKTCFDYMGIHKSGM